MLSGGRGSPSVVAVAPTVGRGLHGNSYKGQHLVGAVLQVQRLRSLLSWRETWQCAGTMVLEKGLRVVHLDLQAAEGDCVPPWAQLSLGHLKASPPQ